MVDLNLQHEAQISLKRLLPRIRPHFSSASDEALFTQRMQAYFPVLFERLMALYGQRYDFFYHLEQILVTAVEAFTERPPAFRARDTLRESEPYWFKSHEMVGGVCYVDHFAGSLNGVRERIPYFLELGITYLHLMPLFDSPDNDNDGGYAISDYRQVAPQLGTMQELRLLAEELHQHGISLVLDFVFNHTSDEHPWALNARLGDAEYRKFYYFFPDRTLPDQYAPHLREIFPEQSPGSFTYLPEIRQWVWTTFRSFQWDLNYTNPETFRAMLAEMLFLANHGVDVLRLDAVAFIWKRLGTGCENLPEVHVIIQAFNALARIAAPALLFKSEAIVHPDDVQSYVRWDESPISYNPTFMALLWEALATREVKLLSTAMRERFQLPDACAWVNYVRVHDDIGWSFADEDAAAVGIYGFDHRQFLNQFYTGHFSGSFASGLPFNFNPVTRDMRISGTTASLAGLEQALETNNEHAVELAVHRILMLYGLIFAAGGIPLIYIGDEIATLNDYSFRSDPARSIDSRWVHRPAFDWKRAENRTDSITVEGRIFQGMQHMIHARKANAGFADKQTFFFTTHNPHVLAFIRNHKIMVVANFAETPQSVSRHTLGFYWPIPATVIDLLTERHIDLKRDIMLEPYEILWLADGKPHGSEGHQRLPPDVNRTGAPV